MTRPQAVRRATCAAPSVVFRHLRILGGLATLALLAACSSGGPQISATQEAAQYAARAELSEPARVAQCLVRLQS